jgi:nardilysin
MMEILKSPNDKRTYTALTLANGLKVLLIHDPEINTTAPVTNAYGALPPTHPDVHDDMLTEDDNDISAMHSDGTSSGEGDDDDEDSGSESEDAHHKHIHSHHDDYHRHTSSKNKKPTPEGEDGAPAKKAAAALSVAVGSFSDPDNLPGLSHYLEHMLFMGSETFPDENEYDSYLSSKGGSSNACTEDEATTYHFDVRSDSLYAALQRFAGFFTCPLIKKDSLEREVEAVDSEFTGVLQSDSCRLSQLRSATAQSGHPANKFGWGNRLSLAEQPAAAGLDVREQLLCYYKQQYGAERMNLVVCGGESLDQLGQWASELFSAIPGGTVGPKTSYASSGMPFQGGKIYILPAVRQGSKIHVTFQFPNLDAAYLKKADDYLSHLIGHEGKGSLLSALKSKGWAYELSAGVSETTSAATIFDASITATDAGLAASPGNGLAIVEYLFGYITMLKQAGPQEWAFKELAAIGGLKFRFYEEGDVADLVADLSSDMHTYPVHHAVAATYLYENWDPQLVNSLLSEMTPEKARIDLQVAEYNDCVQGLKDIIVTMGGEKKKKVEEVAVVEEKQEEWFNFPYAVANVPEKLIEQWKTVTPGNDLCLPPKNNYLPTDFSLKSIIKSPTTAIAIDMNGDHMEQNQAATTVFPSPPNLLIDTPGLRVFHKLDTTFKQPKVAAFFRLSFPESSPFYNSPRSAALTHLAVKLLEDGLCETAYLADVAGLRYSIHLEGRLGLDIKIGGFSHRLPDLTRYVFSMLSGLGKHVEENREAFARVKEALLLSYANANLSPLKHATWIRLRTLRAGMFKVDDVKAELEMADIADVVEHLNNLFSPSSSTSSSSSSYHLEALLLGNMVEEEASTLVHSVQTILGSETCILPADQRAPDCAAILPSNTILLKKTPTKNPEEENSVVEAYIQCCPDALMPRVTLDLVDQLMYEPCYDTLRTKEQLGYTVFSGLRLSSGMLGFCIIVQSGGKEEIGPNYVQVRIDSFLQSFKSKLQEMSDEEFEENKQALIQQKMQKDVTLGEEGEKAWEAITSRKYNFMVRRDEVECLRSRVMKEEVMAFFKQYIAMDAPYRKAMNVHIVGKLHRGEKKAVIEGEEGSSSSNLKVFDDCDVLRESLEMYIGAEQQQQQQQQHLHGLVKSVKEELMYAEAQQQQNGNVNGNNNSKKPRIGK